MTKYKDEVKEKWSPSMEDVNKLRENLSKYPQERVNGKIQSPFDLYCKSVDIIYFNEFGETIVIQPFNYSRLSETNNKLLYIQAVEFEKELHSNPQRRLDLLKKIKEMGDSFKV